MNLGARAAAGEQVWRMPIALRLSLVLVGIIFVVVGVALGLHGVGATRGDNSDYFQSSAANILVGLAGILGGCVVVPAVIVRTRLALTSSDLIVQNVLRGRRIPRANVLKLSYDRDGLVVTFDDRGKTRVMTSSAAQGILGLRLFKLRPRAARIAEELNLLLRQSPLTAPTSE